MSDELEPHKGSGLKGIVSRAKEKLKHGATVAKEKGKFAIAKGRVKAHKARMKTEYDVKNYLAERKEYHQSDEYKQKVAEQRAERKRKIQRFSRNIQKKFKEPKRRSSYSRKEESAGIGGFSSRGLAGITGGSGNFGIASGYTNKSYKKKSKKESDFFGNIGYTTKSKKKGKKSKRRSSGGFGIGKNPGFKI